MDIPRSVDLVAATAKRSLFLFGPRRTGRSTRIRQQLASAKQFHLLERDSDLTLQRHLRRVREWCCQVGALVEITEQDTVREGLRAMGSPCEVDLSWKRRRGHRQWSRSGGAREGVGQ